MNSSSGLLFGLADNRRPDSLSSRLRRQRFQTFAAMLHSLPEPARILDIGGTVEFWRAHLPLLAQRAEITIVNLNHTAGATLTGVISIRADARDLSQFADRSFDLCFSNSLIEHVGTFSDQLATAREIRRIARGYFVQTPNRYFPIEPHFLVPGWQFVPLWLRAWLVQQRSFGWMPRVTSPRDARTTVESIRLLTATEMHTLFPEATLLREKIGPLTKSFISLRLARP